MQCDLDKRFDVFAFTDFLPLIVSFLLPRHLYCGYVQEYFTFLLESIRAGYTARTEEREKKESRHKQKEKPSKKNANEKPATDKTKDDDYRDVGEEKNSSSSATATTAVAEASLSSPSKWPQAEEVSDTALLGLSRTPFQYGLARKSPMRSFMSPTTSSKHRQISIAGTGTGNGSRSQSSGRGQRYFTVDEEEEKEQQKQQRQQKHGRPAGGATSSQSKAVEEEKREKGWNVWAHRNVTHNTHLNKRNEDTAKVGFCMPTLQFVILFRAVFRSSKLSTTRSASSLMLLIFILLRFICTE
jgi:FtsZ-interacting cell division protein YlmF